MNPTVTTGLLVGGVLALICFGGLFAAVDAAVSTVSPARVAEQVRDHRPGAVWLSRLIADPAGYVNLVVLLRIGCEITATALLVFLLHSVLSLDSGLVVAAATMTVISFVVIGVGPRTLGRQHAYSIARSAALPLYVVAVLLTPVTRLLVLLGNALTPGRGFRNGPFASEVELREVVDMAERHGVVAAEQGRMIQSVLRLAATPAREVMVPRTGMVWIALNAPVAEAVDLAVRSGHSRIPVIGVNVDDVVGVVYLKDLVQRAYYSTGGSPDTSVSQVMRPARFVPDSKPLDALLGEMQRNRYHLALLVDEYGAIAGLATIEDILEEIVGEITDEYDRGEVAPITDLGNGAYRVSARLPVAELDALYGGVPGLTGDDVDVDTVAGLLALALGRVPMPGAQVVSHGLRLRAEGVRDNRGRVRVGAVLVSPEPNPTSRQPLSQPTAPTSTQEVSPGGR